MAEPMLEQIRQAIDTSDKAEDALWKLVAPFVRKFGGVDCIEYVSLGSGLDIGVSTRSGPDSFTVPLDLLDRTDFEDYEWADRTLVHNQRAVDVRRTRKEDALANHQKIVDRLTAELEALDG